MDSRRKIEPFTWGADTYRPDKFVEVAARVMSRRQVSLGEAERAHLLRIHAARWTARR
jgi:hypothetical protein